MDDATILNRIGTLVDEERALYRKAEREGGLSEDERARLRALKVALDQAWDLLDQRRALREAGRDPDEARRRPPSVVENYEQ